MKNISYLIGALLIGSATACTPPIITQTNYPSQQPHLQPQVDNSEVTDQTFYDNLAPDGRWINDPEIGYVWSPSVGADFRPYYTNGHWNYTDYGWTWVSDYRWGWATFHYGRWKYDTAYGWVWAPGKEWGPAWVQWRKTPESYGWAPLEPGISIEVGFSSGYHIPENHWTFVPQQHIADRNFSEYSPPVQQNNVYINRSTIINNNITINNVHNTTINNVTNNTTINNNDNRKYIGGPNVREVENVTNQKVKVYNIQNGSRPGATTESNNAINIYRPQVRSNSGHQGDNNTAAPKMVYPYRQNVPTGVIPNFHPPKPNGNDNSQTVQPAQKQNNEPSRRNNQNNEYNQNSQAADQQQPRRRDNNITTQPVNPAVTSQRQDVPVLNPAENQHRTPGDVTPNTPNNNLPRQPRQPQQPRNDKNEQTSPTQQQTPQPANRNSGQNSPFQQRQNPVANPNNVPNTTPPAIQNPRQPFQNNNQNNNPDNPNYNKPQRTQPATQIPQQQPVNNRNTPNANQQPSQKNGPVVQPQIRQNNNHVKTVTAPTTPVTTPPQTKKEDNKPQQQQ